jgi:metal-sulfur cluster biosynthetic enzyme
LVEKIDVVKQLQDVVDPEIGVSIVELDLVDEIVISGGEVGVAFHFTAPFCPPMFAMEMAEDIKRRVSSIPGVTQVKLTMSGHFMADEISKKVNGPASASTEAKSK